DIYLVNVHRDEDIFGVNDQVDTSMFDANNDLQGEKVVEEVIAASIATFVAAATTDVTIDELTLAKAFAELKSAKPRADKVVIQEQDFGTTTTTIAVTAASTRPKAKSIVMQEPSKTPKTTTIPKAKKIENENESTELKRCLEIVPDDGDEVTIDATPLSSNKLLKNFNREDLKVLWRLVKERFVKTKPEDDMDSFLLHTLKTMFKHHVEDNMWKNQQGLVKVKNWKLYDSCGIHCVTMQNTLYYLLVEKMYPLTNHTLRKMLNNVKLQVDEGCEMAYGLLRLVKKQLKEGYKAN
nr:hypothetical protein [Tanacetum cinerariifolium]